MSCVFFFFVDTLASEEPPHKHKTKLVAIFEMFLQHLGISITSYLDFFFFFAIFIFCAFLVLIETELLTHYWLDAVNKGLNTQRPVVPSVMKA